VRQHTFGQRKEALLFILPLALFLGVFVLTPVAGTIIGGMFRDTTFLKKEFIFLDNYRTLFADAAFRQSFRFTLLFVAVSVPLELALGTVFALLVNQPPVRFRTALRVSVLIPWAIPAAISGRIWELIYNYNFGLANYLLSALGIRSEPVNWLGNDMSAFFSLVAADAWKTTPFMAIILLAGLQAIPTELYQQAEIDGAGFLKRFIRVTLPILKPVMVVALVFRTIDAIRIFDIVYVITHGGPGGSTSSLSLYAYKYFLAGDFGYGSAVSFILFLTALGLSLIYINLGAFRKEFRKELP